MKIGYISDLHLDNYIFNKESNDFIFGDGFKTDADVLVLAGDIGEYKYMFAHLANMQKLAKKVGHLIIVEGNHEFYEGDIQVKPDASIYGSNVSILRNDSVVLGDVTFYGGTLWAQLSDLDSLDQFNIKQMISDFKLIKNGNRSFSIDDVTAEYNKFIEGFYEIELMRTTEKLVVVSHFAPSMKSVTPRFASSALNPYFCNNLDELIEGSSASYWIHGHVHSHHDYMIGNTRILCNPRGYPREIGNSPEIKYVEI